MGRFPDPGPWKLPRSQTVRLSEALGISDLPVQRVRRSKRRPYVFNIMTAGMQPVCRIGHNWGAIWSETKCFDCRRIWSWENHFHEHPFQRTAEGEQAAKESVRHANCRRQPHDIWYETLTLFTLSIQSHSELPSELNEDGVTLHLTVIDTPGFGDQLNRETKFVRF